MKSILRHASPLIPLLLVACASTQGTAHSPKPVSAPLSASMTSNDTAYMARVESIASRRGVQVVWINPPSKAGRDE